MVFRREGSTWTLGRRAPVTTSAPFKGKDPTSLRLRLAPDHPCLL
jgi:hypothetical protein